MNIVVVTWDYPDETRSVFPFVKSLVLEWCRQGHRCTVVAPFSITKNRRFHLFKSMEKEGEQTIEVLRPNFVSFSDITLFGYHLSTLCHKRAVLFALSKLSFKPDFVYCHFWKIASEVLPYVHKFNLPLFVATGESDIQTMFDVKTDVTFLRDYIRGVICVSSKNRDESIKLGLTTYDKCRVFPNAVNANVFSKRDKTKCRKLLNLPQDVFIVVYVGWFNQRKGSTRVASAIEKMVYDDIYSIFVGSGNMEPSCKNILYKGRANYEDVPLFLNSADVFCLPTLKEGCCNAVIEAMACGLPIISSDLPFNWDVLDHTNSILIDPNDINAISKAIESLRNNEELREQLSRGALEKVKTLTIEKRASSIMNFIKDKVS